MYPENKHDPALQRGEKPFEPTPIELRKQYNTLDNLIRTRSGELKEENSQSEANSGSGENEGNDGFLPPFNSAF